MPPPTLAPEPVLPSPLESAWPRPVPELRGQSFTPSEFHTLPQPERWQNRRLFLLNTHVWEQGMANPVHNTCVDVANETLREAFPTGYRIRVQLGMVLPDDSLLIPDILIAQGNRSTFLTDHPTTAALVVEVSDTTLFFDTTTKAELYATAGVPEYWVVAVNARTLQVFRDPAPIASNGHSYRSTQTLTEHDTVTPLAAPGHTLRVAELLP